MYDTTRMEVGYESRKLLYHTYTSHNYYEVLSIRYAHLKLPNHKKREQTRSPSPFNCRVRQTPYRLGIPYSIPLEPTPGVTYSMIPKYETYGEEGDQGSSANVSFKKSLLETPGCKRANAFCGHLHQAAFFERD